MNKALPLVTACVLACQVTIAQKTENASAAHRTNMVPVSAAGGDGFKAEYYNGPNFNHKVFTRIEKQINFVLVNRSPASGIDAGYFSVRWTGKVFAPKTGNYYFRFVADDGVRLWINHKLVIDEWYLNPPTTFSGKIYLQGNQLYDLKIEYSQMKPYQAVAQASWSFENEPDQLLTAKHVYSSPPKNLLVASATKPATKTAVPPPPKKETPKKAPSQSTAKPVVAQKKEVLAKVVKTPVKDKPVAGKKAEPAKTITKVSKPAVPAELTASGNKQDPEEEKVEAIEVGKSFVLTNIYFDQSQAVLRPESYAELDKLAAILRQHPQLAIRVTGHTDNVGDFFLNAQLSRDRAKAVADYLISKGIAPERVECKGLGCLYPIAPNTTEENKTKNRRVEFAFVE